MQKKNIFVGGRYCRVRTGMIVVVLDMTWWWTDSGGRFDRAGIADGHAGRGRGLLVWDTGLFASAADDDDVSEIDSANLPDLSGDGRIRADEWPLRGGLGVARPDELIRVDGWLTRQGYDTPPPPVEPVEVEKLRVTAMRYAERADVTVVPSVVATDDGHVMMTSATLRALVEFAAAADGAASALNDYVAGMKLAPLTGPWHSRGGLGVQRKRDRIREWRATTQR